ncbi:hypothetical protein KY284_036064 [Solanum tuberosum]|nr:hypothetical protein KY284_036064 [Solanum tuberosum]
MNKVYRRILNSDLEITKRKEWRPRRFAGGFVVRARSLPEMAPQVPMLAGVLLLRTGDGATPDDGIPAK